MKKTAWLVTGLLPVCGAGWLMAGTTAKMEARMQARGPGLFALRAVQELDLSAEQKSRVASILKANRTDVQVRMDALRTARQTLVEAATAESVDEAAVRAACRTLASQKEDLVVLATRIGADVRNVLTPEQREKVQAFRAVARGRMDDRREDLRELIDTWIDQNAG